MPNSPSDVLRGRRRRTLLTCVGALSLCGGIAEGAGVDDNMPRKETGAVIWRADAERPLSEEWSGLVTATHPMGVRTSEGISDERISRVAWPVANGSYAYRVQLNDGDRAFGERAEAGQGNPVRNDRLDRLFNEGEERWISFRIRLDADFPISADTWQVIAQIKQLGELGTPVLALEARNGNWRLSNSDSNGVSSGTRTILEAPAVVGRWVRMTFRIRFSPDPTLGFVEWFSDLDGQGSRLVGDRHHTWTMKRNPSSGRAIPSHARMGIYRDDRISGTGIAYYDDWTVATTRELAEGSRSGPS